MPYHSEESGARYTPKSGTLYTRTRRSDSEYVTFTANLVPEYYGEEGSSISNNGYSSWGLDNLSCFTERDKLLWHWYFDLEGANYHYHHIYGYSDKSENYTQQPGQKSFCIIKITYPK